MAMRLYRYPDLVARKIVTNRVTLARWQRANGFPASIRLGPNSVAFNADEVDIWVRSRLNNAQSLQSTVDKAEGIHPNDKVKGAL
ncbi:helix-turn-helix transcriptional regulator [Dongia rigui]|uniref:AlpA family phage regulatory protein n=1 Tax=Dongia rigui TaxID=940149 RepID=A0ABU5E0T8_9PROT|nr:AlpA family phage regulatory protein [Dongia rigui]MDY0873114.1 AlpA family phage regulatory protein [Dongia rigui]